MPSGEEGTLKATMRRRVPDPPTALYGWRAICARPDLRGSVRLHGDRPIKQRATATLSGCPVLARHMTDPRVQRGSVSLLDVPHVMNGRNDDV